MDLNTFQPTFLIQIEGQALAADIKTPKGRLAVGTTSDAPTAPPPG